MKKVITYGTFDMLHYGHINLLKRAKELGDYLIVGVTTDNFDINRGKINTRQSLEERYLSVSNLDFVDEVIVEEYEGQKIDDIRKRKVDIFAIGSDWKGKFDYLSDYCQVVYLDRTEGISSTDLRNKEQSVRLGIVGYSKYVEKFIRESKNVASLEIVGIFGGSIPSEIKENNKLLVNSYEELLEKVDAVYIYSSIQNQEKYAEKALDCGKHVMCEPPISLKKEDKVRLYKKAKNNNVILFETIKTAYFIAFSRLLVLLKSKIIGDIKSVDVTCTSLDGNNYWSVYDDQYGGSLVSWGPYALFAVLSILGTKYRKCEFTTFIKDNIDLFTKVDFLFDNAVATVKVGVGVKSEGELIISGTKGYIYIPSPWWKTDYFEVRYENFNNNKRYFYELKGEGLRYEQLAFIRCIRERSENFYLEENISIEISKILEMFFDSEIGKQYI